MNQNGTDQHTTHQEKRLDKVEDNYSEEKKISFYNKQLREMGDILPWPPLNLNKGHPEISFG